MRKIEKEKKMHKKIKIEKSKNLEELINYKK